MIPHSFVSDFGDQINRYVVLVDKNHNEFDVKTRGVLTGTEVCRQAPSVSHLLFANDCFLFFKANEDKHML